MSITVKNIAFSINGTPSKQFNIELDGAKYSLNKFKMTQKLLEPCKLEFSLCKAPDEDINEIQFTTCGSIIGKDVTLSLQTDSMEQEIQGFSEGSQNSDIEFEGIVTSAKATRKESEYGIEVVAETKDTVMNDSPDFNVFNEMSLADIIKDVTDYAGVEAEIDPKKTDPIFYTVKFNETSYEFLQRLAQRHGEWMFNNGKKLHFGKFGEQDSIVLAYPSRDLPQYSACLKTFHTKKHFLQISYNETHSIGVSGADDDKLKDCGNKLSDTTYAISNEKYAHKTGFESESISMERDDDITKIGDLGKEIFRETPTAFREGRRANMLVYEGNTYCSKMKIGAKLTIKDNYLSSGSSEEKSEVQQDEILITEVVHEFNIDQEYSNTFKGITAALDYPPYLDPTIYPVCNHPVKGVVKDTEDPKHWGRVRIRFNVPQLRADGSEDKKKWTPWIHVSQPYSGSEDPKFGTHLIPEINSQVFVEFVGGNMERPYVAGCNMSALFTPVDDAWYPGTNNVKAIRTASGHTIEVHDTETKDNWGDKGYIRIYDNKLNYYELLLSTDRKLIKLKSAGNIDLQASNDINIKAGHDINVEAGNDFFLQAKHDITQMCDNEFYANSEADMYLKTSKILTIVSNDDTHITTKKDRHDHIDGKYRIETKKDLEVKSFSNAGFDVTKKFAVKSMDIQMQAQNSYKEYSMTHEINAQASINFTATATIDIKAPLIKES